jgi:hypothetical protein
MGRCKHEQTTSISWTSTISENQVVKQMRCKCKWARSYRCDKTKAKDLK